MATRHIFRTAAVTVILAFLVTGCAVTGYRLGSTLPRDVRTIYIPTLRNETSEPSLEVEATDAITAEFQKDGALKVVPNAESADLLLEVTLISYDLQPLGYDADRGKTANEYRIRMKAKVLCKNLKTNTIRVSTQVVGKTTFTPSGGIALSKREALPAAATDLARNVVEQIVEGW